MRLVILTLGWVCGIYAALGWRDALPPAFWLLALSVAGMALALTWPTRHRLLCAAVLLVALAGYRSSFLPTTSAIARYNNADGLTFEGVVVAAPDVRDDRVQLRVRAEWLFDQHEKIRTQGLVLVDVPRYASVRYGDLVQVTGRLRTPPVLDAFSYADYLARQGIFSWMPEASVVVVEQGHGLPWRGWLFDLRTQAQQHIRQALPDPQAALLIGILLGNERGLAADVNAAFELVGASHIIAISGFNMVVISGAVMAVARNLLPRRSAVIVGLLVIALYTLFVAGNPAVVRAAIMSSLLILAEGLRRQVYLPASLAFAVLLMSFENPLVLWDASFQLSFGAVLGIALFASPINRALQNRLRPRLPDLVAQPAFRVLTDAFGVTLAVLALTLPLTILYFERMSPYVLLVNVLIVPVQAPLLILGGLATVLAFVWPGAAQILYWLDMLFLSWSLSVVRGVAEWPLAGLPLRFDPRWVTLGYVLAIGGAMLGDARPQWAESWLRWVRQRGALLWLTLAAGGMAILLFAALVSRPDGRLHVWFLDVGHSNAVLLQSPGGAQVLVDGGRSPARLLTALGERLPFTDRTLEALIITHPDPFDTAALPDVLAHYATGIVLHNGQRNLGPAWEHLNTALDGHDVLEVQAGMTLDFSDGLQLEILHPTSKPAFGAPPGDGALVLRVRYGAVSFLLAGDITREGQAALLANGQWPLASVLQIPQHGTQRALDGAFLQAVQPQVAVLQSDPANLRGDPEPDVLAMLGDVPLYRTDQSGTLHFWTDGGALWVQAR